MSEKEKVIKYLFLKELSGKEMCVDMIGTLGDQRSSNATIKNWIAEYKRGKSDQHRPGRSICVTTPENIDSVHDMIRENQHIGIKNIAEALYISY